MPNCFQLTFKGETEPMKLVDVDKMLCQHFNVPVDPREWYENWYNSIGLSLAMGVTWENIEKAFPERKEIIDYLKANFNVDSWAER
jgi:hypothetical protein